MTNGSRPRIVVGFGRSGTTWVQDVVAESNDLRAVFEPLHPALVRNAGLTYLDYREPDDEDPDLRAYLERYISGDFHSLWADYRFVPTSLWFRPHENLSVDSLRRVFRSQRRAVRNVLSYRKQRRFAGRVVKLVRASMMLSWLQRTFNARMVYIVRHPVAVVMSKLRAPYAWNCRSMLGRYKEDRRWMQALDKDFSNLLTDNLSDTEAHTLQWSIEVQVALQQARAAGIPVVSYEQLVENSDNQWPRIWNALELEKSPDVELVSAPSQQAWGESARSADAVRMKYMAWMSRCDAETLASVERILDATGMRLYSVNRALPEDEAPFKD